MAARGSRERSKFRRRRSKTREEVYTSSEKHQHTGRTAETWEGHSDSPVSAADLKAAADEFREARVAPLDGGKTARAAVVPSREALRLLEAAERFRADRLRDMRAKIAEGLASLNRGEGLDGEDVFRELEEAISGPRGKRAGDEPVDR